MSPGERIGITQSIERDDQEDTGHFNRRGGIHKAYQLFGNRLPAILEELNGRLAA